MIVETILATLDQRGDPNFAPMGILWGADRLTVRPFRTSHTFSNLVTAGYGVINITDDVLAYVRSALYDAVLPHFPAKFVPGVVYQGTCAWREIEVVSQTGNDERAELNCRVIYNGRQRDFLGFCRAANAVIEAAILATRLSLINSAEIAGSMTRYRSVIEKTGDEREKQAFQLVHEYVQQRGTQ